MIYLKHTTEEQYVLIPNSTGRRDVWQVVLQLKSTFNSCNVAFVGVVDEASLQYIPMRVQFSEDVVCGEYEYTLSDEMGVISSGLLVIGEVDNPTEYKKEIAYEQYTE